VTKEGTSHPILLYDGVCGLCNRTVRFVLRRDRRDLFRFASLQSALARRILCGHQINPSILDTFYVVIGFDAARVPKERVLSRSDGVIYVLRELGGVWKVVAGLFQLFPRELRDWGYNAVASRRYRIFGRCETCPLPSEENQGRFLDV
jgi:predicted DCC family thiol-disulfide oxidoreductase YuxK